MVPAHGNWKVFMGRLSEGGYREYNHAYIPYIPPSPKPETKAGPGFGQGWAWIWSVLDLDMVRPGPGFG